jgi:hypothetical protein
MSKETQDNQSNDKVKVSQSEKEWDKLIKLICKHYEAKI